MRGQTTALAGDSYEGVGWGVAVWGDGGDILPSQKACYTSVFSIDFKSLYLDTHKSHMKSIFSVDKVISDDFLHPGIGKVSLHRVRVDQCPYENNCTRNASLASDREDFQELLSTTKRLRSGSSSS